MARDGKVTLVEETDEPGRSVGVDDFPVPSRATDQGMIAKLLPTIGAQESIAPLKMMRECAFRIAAADCGCAGLARCIAGHGRDGLVNHFDCFACLSAVGQTSQTAKEE
jgi:hypothetical protein